MSDAECRRELTALLEFSKPKYKNDEVFVHFLGWFQNDTAIYIAMEYIPLGDLEYNLQELEKSNYKGCVLSEEEVIDIIAHILEGVKIMHAEGFAHRDLKPQNVLVVQKKPKWRVKLGDFGLSKRRTEGSAFRSQAGTQSYMAPEIFHYVPGLHPESSEYTNAVDIWALGCIMYRILTGKPPFLDLWSLQRYCNAPDLLVPPIKSPMTVTMRRADSFVRLLLMPYPDARPSAALALEHPWFTKVVQPSALAETEVNQESVYVGPAKTTSKYPLTDVRTISAAIDSNSSQFDYNTTSHAGLHSNYQRPPEVNQKTVVSPGEWSVADIPRMPKPVPGAFDAERFGSLGLSEGVTPTIKEEPETQFSKSQVEERDCSDEDGWNVANTIRVSPIRREDATVEDEWDYSPVQRPLTKPGPSERPSVRTYSISGSRRPEESLIRGLYRRFMEVPPKKPNDRVALHVVFITPSGFEINMSVTLDDTVREIKSRLFRTDHIPTSVKSASWIRLSYDGKLLAGSSTIAGCGIKSGSRIKLYWTTNLKGLYDEP